MGCGASHNKPVSHPGTNQNNNQRPNNPNARVQNNNPGRQQPGQQNQIQNRTGQAQAQNVPNQNIPSNSTGQAPVSLNNIQLQTNSQNIALKNVLVIYAHPEPNSFVGAMKDTILRVLKVGGFETQLSDLYEMNWNPIVDQTDFYDRANLDYFSVGTEQKHAAETGHYAEDIKLEHDKIKWADCIIFVFPLWWGSMPAIMKGWIERCFFPQLIYDTRKLFNEGLMKNKKAMFVLSTSSPENMYQKNGLNRITLNDCLHGLEWGTLRFCGFKMMQSFYAHGIDGADEETRKQILVDLEKTFKNIRGIPDMKFSNES